jgi:hypothetical protein
LRVDRYLPLSLIASVAAAPDCRPPPERRMIHTIERLAGGCLLYRLDVGPLRREPSDPKPMNSRSVTQSPLEAS